MGYSEDVLRMNPELRGVVDVVTKTPSKYHNARAEMMGIRFQSGHEADVIGKLVIADEHHAGVHGLRLQVPFELPGGIIYQADATYIDDQLQGHVIDAKAWDVKTQKYLRTPEYRLKRRLFKGKYGREIEEL